MKNELTNLSASPTRSRTTNGKVEFNYLEFQKD